MLIMPSRPGAPMPTPYESARLNLQLFELRREPRLREARQWFILDFHPDSLQSLVADVQGEHNADFRMVLDNRRH